MLGIKLAVVVVAALIGAGIVAWRCQRTHFPLLTGSLLGAGAGAVGSLLFMLPLNFCTFELERTGLDMAVGLGLIALGLAIPVGSLDWWLRQRDAKARGLLREEFRQGVFRNWGLAWLCLAPTLIILLFISLLP
ncbi:MAG: hypothetical protein HC924_06410, partial [Synechococcaceae cyanobacterium SM2_3_2]|nr:hypothetical protein [Synechococcaceae cyanobacterium SM2_3_2]